MIRKDKKLQRIIALALIILGLILGVTWNKEGFCIGDNIFFVLGLPAWSSGESGTHYPAVLGSISILLGIGVLNRTLEAKTQKYLWPSLLLAYIVLNVVASFI